jgi:hypothetical protein
MKGALIGALSLVVSATLQGTELADRSPWQVVMQAELIMVARVVNVGVDLTIDPSTSPPYSDEQFAILEVLDVWKGDPGGEVRVDFELSAPAEFTPGEVVLAFLERGESKAQRWRADAQQQAEAEEAISREYFPELEPSAGHPHLSHDTEDGIRRFETWAAGRWVEILSEEIFGDENDEVDSLREVVLEAVRLQALGAVDEVSEQEWLVSVAERPSTRAVSLNKLDADTLTQDQLARLASSFVRQPAIDGTDLDMLVLLSEYTDPDVDRTAVAVVEAGLRMDPIPWWMVPMVAETLLRFGSDFGEIYQRISPDPTAHLAENWEFSRRARGIPHIAPAEARDGSRPTPPD